MAHWFRLARVLLAAALVVALLVGVLACGPKTATLKFTLKDPKGAAVAGATIAVQGAQQAVTTDAQGKATVSGIEPGQVSIVAAGPGMRLERRETVKAGTNEFSWQLEAEQFAPLKYTLLSNYTMKVTKADGTVVLDGTLVKNLGARWVMGAKEVVSLANATYIKPSGKDWQVVQGPMTQGLFWTHLQLVQTFVGRIDVLNQIFGDSDQVVTPQPRQTVNGQECAVFDVHWEVTIAGQYRFFVAASGQAKGHVVRYQWDQPGYGQVTVDISDIDNPDLTVVAPI